MTTTWTDTPKNSDVMSLDRFLLIEGEYTLMIDDTFSLLIEPSTGEFVSIWGTDTKNTSSWSDTVASTTTWDSDTKNTSSWTEQAKTPTTW